MRFETVVFDDHFYSMLKNNRYDPPGCEEQPLILDPGPNVENPEDGTWQREPFPGVPLALTVLQTLAVHDRRPTDGEALFRWTNKLDRISAE